jgi:hypothetical protein
MFFIFLGHLYYGSQHFAGKFAMQFRKGDRK